MAEDEARMKKEAEEKASREPKSIPVIGGHTETEDSGKVVYMILRRIANTSFIPIADVG